MYVCMHASYIRTGDMISTCHNYCNKLRVFIVINYFNYLGNRKVIPQSYQS